MKSGLKIIVISLPDSPRRQQLEWLNFPFEWKDGVLIDDANRKAKLEQHGVSSNLPTGDLGCALAHLEVWQILGWDRSYKEGALILEDDAEPIPFTRLALRDDATTWHRRTVAEIQYNLRDGWDFIDLTNIRDWGLQAAFITARGARLLYDARQEMLGDLAIDQYIKRGLTPELKFTRGVEIFRPRRTKSEREGRNKWYM